MRLMTLLWVGVRHYLAGSWSFGGNGRSGRGRAEVPVGVAAVDITPGYPIRLVGYGSRKTESEGIESPLKARALVIGGDDEASGARRSWWLSIIVPSAPM